MNTHFLRPFSTVSNIKVEASLRYVLEDAPLTPDISLKLDLAEPSRGSGPTFKYPKKIIFLLNKHFHRTNWRLVSELVTLTAKQKTTSQIHKKTITCNNIEENHRNEIISRNRVIVHKYLQE